MKSNNDIKKSNKKAKSKNVKPKSAANDNILMKNPSKTTVGKLLIWILCIAMVIGMFLTLGYIIYNSLTQV